MAKFKKLKKLIPKLTDPDRKYKISLLKKRISKLNRAISLLGSGDLDKKSYSGANWAQKTVRRFLELDQKRRFYRTSLKRLIGEDRKGAI